MLSKFFCLLLSLCLVTPSWAAMEFDGTDDYVDTTADYTEFGIAFSISAWVYDDGGTVSCGDGNAVAFSIGGNIFANRLGRWQNDYGGFPFATAAAMDQNRWVHVVITSSGSAAGQTAIFYDGVRKDDGAAAGSLNNGSFRIGGQDVGTARCFSGLIDNVQAYSRVLTDSEIQSLAKSRSRLPITDGLVGWWPLDQGGDGALPGATPDSAGSSDGTFVGFDDVYAAHSSTTTGYALEFDGVDDTVDLPATVIAPATGMSVCAWARLDAAGNFPIISQFDNNWGQIELRFHSTEMKPSWSANTRGITSPDAVGLGEWHFICGTSDTPSASVTQKVYVDGVEKNTESTTLAVAPTQYTLGEIGSRAGSSLFFQGAIDDVRIYNIPLSSTDIQNLYDGVAISTQPTARYQFDVLPGPKEVSDISGKGNHGTPSSVPVWRASDWINYQ